MSTEKNATPAQELRAAASKIRERMTDASNAVWCEEYAHWAIRHVERNCDLDTLDHAEWHDADEVCEGFGMYAGRYIALWNPITGGLTASLLESVAIDMETNADCAGYAWDEALKLARAINGGAR